MTTLMETMMNQWMKWGAFFSDKPTIKIVGGLTTYDIQDGAPPSYKLVYKPINYRYIINKNHSEIGVMFTNLAIERPTTLYDI